MRAISAALVLIGGAIIFLTASHVQPESRSAAIAILGFLIVAVGFVSWCIAFFRSKDPS
jgi:hypothetical protein